MTERLSDLLTREAHDLDVPAAPTAAVLRTGRRLRRRRQALTGAAGLAVVAAIGGTALAVNDGKGAESAPDPAAGVSAPVFAAGTTVYYDGPDNSVVIDDKAVKSLFYTSAGVAVRQGNNSYSDGGGPQRFSLVTPTGENQPLGLVTEETVHASDPDQPYVAYAENVAGILEAVVYDVATDEEAARVPLGSTKESWFPVSLDGDRLYVQDGYGGKVYDVEWRTGEQRISELLDEAWEIRGGHAAITDESGAAVIDVDGGEVLLSADEAGYFRLSPDGRFAQFVSEESELGDPAKAESTFHDLETGGSVTLAGEPYGWGWTTDGELFTIDTEAAELTTCSAVTGECTTAAVDLPKQPAPEQTEEECETDIDQHGNEIEFCTAPTAPVLEIRLGGRVYES